MKKMILGLVAAALMSTTASAALLTFSSSFNGIGVVTPTTPGTNTFSFDTFTINNLDCQPTNCTTFAFATGLQVGPTSETFTWTLTNAQTIQFIADSGFTILTAGAVTHLVDLRGTFTNLTTTDSAAGRLTFSWSGTAQSPQQFSGDARSDSAAPEPGSMALLGFGLVGLGFVARRRSFRK